MEAEVREAGYPQGFRIRNISVSLEEGEALIITGPSGSGKTTLIKTLLGLIKLDNGHLDGWVRINGIDPYMADPGQTYRLTGYIPQEPWYGIIGYTVDSEYCLSLSQAGKRCEQSMLGKYGLAELQGHVTYGLSAGQYQRLVWASSIDRKPSLLLVDEPLVFIDDKSRHEFTKYVSVYLANGGAAVIVDHQPKYWRGIADKMMVLKDGEPVYCGEYDEHVIPRTAVKPLKKASRKGRLIVRAENIYYKYPGEPLVLEGAEIRVYGGVITGITGRNGAGKTTLLKILAGIYKPIRGRVWRNGSVLYIPEEPLLYYSHPTIREELYSTGAGREAVGEIVELFKLENALDRPIARLSSGERRRGAIASAIIRNADAILLDEPSSGLDPHNLLSLMDALVRTAERGVGLVIATHDPRLMGVVDEAYRLERGVLERVS